MAPNGADPALPAGGTSGVLPGLEATLLQLLQNYRPGDIGICEIADKIQIVLPLNDWEWFGWGGVYDLSLTGGQSSAVEIFTVPKGQRVWLDAVLVDRSSGDNLGKAVRVVYPEHSRDGNGIVDLVQLSTGDGNVYWPDPGGDLSVAWSLGGGPVLMEEGTILEFVPWGSGVSASVFEAQCRMRRTRVGKTLAPYV